MDSEIKLKANGRRIKYKDIEFAADADGFITVPKICVPDLIAAGAQPVEKIFNIDVRKELETCPSHHLSNFLNARGLADHYHEKFKHHLSDELREYAKTHQWTSKSNEDLLVTAADNLDGYFQLLHQKGSGLIKFIPDDEKRRKCLEIFDKENKK